MHFAILRVDKSECIRNSIEHREHTCDQNRFGNFTVSPTVISQTFDIFRRSPVRMQSHFFTELQESDFIFRQSRLIKVARNNCIDRYGFILQLQEVCVRTGSVRALIERRNSGRNQLFEAPSNFSICKLKRVAKRHHPFEDFGIMTETLQDLRKVRPIRIRLQPRIVNFFNFAGRFCFGNPIDLRFQDTTPKKLPVFIFAKLRVGVGKFKPIDGR